MNDPVVEITGMGCICAPGDHIADIMARLYSGSRMAAPPQKIMSEVNADFPVFEVDNDLEQMDVRATRTSRLARHALEEAIAQSGWAFEDLAGLRVGVCMGTTVGCTLNNEPFYRDYRVGNFPGLEAINRFLHNNPARYLADTFGFKGPVTTIANACSSGTDAIGMGKTWLEKDWCDVVIAGGADELSRITYLGFISLLISSAEACRPFDKNRDGLNLGEGAAVVIMEKQSLSRKRGHHPLARVIGYGTYADAYHPTAPHPEGIGLRKAIKQALDQGGIDAAQVAGINAHGTSTPNNDKVEGLVIADIFNRSVPVVSTKAYTGHTLGAAGAIEAVFAIQALLDQKLPPTAGFTEADPDCLIKPTTDVTPISGDYMLSNSLAFGGNNSTLLLGRAV